MELHLQHIEPLSMSLHRLKQASMLLVAVVYAESESFGLQVCLIHVLAQVELQRRQHALLNVQLAITILLILF